MYVCMYVCVFGVEGEGGGEGVLNTAITALLATYLVEPSRSRSNRTTSLWGAGGQEDMK